MADPVSMGVAAGMQAVGTVMSAIDQSKQLKASARADRENARRSELQGELQVLQTRRDERQASGAAIAALGESGLAIGTGSAADLIRQNAIERETEILNIRYQAGQEAENLRASAINKKRAAKTAIIMGVMNAVSQGAQAASGISGQAKLDAQAETERQSRLPRTGATLVDPARYGGGNRNIGQRGPFGRTRYFGSPWDFDGTNY